MNAIKKKVVVSGASSGDRMGLCLTNGSRVLVDTGMASCAKSDLSCKGSGRRAWARTGQFNLMRIGSCIRP